MSNEERLVTPDEVDKTPVKKKSKKKNFFVRAAKAIAKYFREMRSELKKVVWPSGKQLVNNTLVALVVIVIAAVVIWGFDTLASKAVEILITICK